MMKLSVDDFQTVIAWIYRNARPINLRRWQFHFEGVNKEAVMKVLSYYQNEDGGYGRLFATGRCDYDSSPAITIEALRIIHEIDYSGNQHPVIQGMFRYLSKIAEFIVPDPPVAALLLRYAEEDSAVYRKALKLTDMFMEKLLKLKDYNFLTVSSYCEFFGILEKTVRTGHIDYQLVKDRLVYMVNSSIERNMNRWEGWCAKPTSFINSPHSAFFSGNEEIVAKELDYIIENKCYYTYLYIGDSYFAEEKIIKNMLLLKNFHRVEFVKSGGRC